MTNTKKRITTILLSVVMAFTMMPMMGAVSHDNTAKAASGNVPEKVKGLKVAKKSDRWVTLKWNKTPGAKKYIVKQINVDFNPNVTGYVNMTHSKWYETNTKTVARTKGTKVTVKKLLCRWKYRFRVVAINKNGKGEYSEKLEVKTKFFGYNKKEKKIRKKLGKLIGKKLKWMEGTCNDFRLDDGVSNKLAGTKYWDQLEAWCKVKNKTGWYIICRVSWSMSFGGLPSFYSGGVKGKPYYKARLIKKNVKGPFTKVLFINQRNASQKFKPGDFKPSGI